MTLCYHSPWKGSLNDLHDATCMTHNRFSDFHCVYTIIYKYTSCSYRVQKSCSYRVFSLQEFKQNDSRTSCSSSNYCTNFQEKQVKAKKRKKEENVWNLCLKEEKNYEILLEELRLEGECNYKILFTNDFWKLWRNISALILRHN